MKDKTYYMDWLKKGFKDSAKPLAKLIYTGKGYFLYDTGTNKILECGKEIFFLLTHIYSQKVDIAIARFIDEYGETRFTEVVEEIIEAVKTEKILLTQPASQFGLSEHFHSFEECMNTGMMSITLEITEQCNLRCGYCLYGDGFSQQRNHGQAHMSRDTAFKAIAFLNHRSSAEDKVSIGFYGGEPLLRFPFIKECVTFAHQTMCKKEVTFNMTTNATLIDEEIADYLMKENFSILVSLDGPQHIHDEYRKDTQGKGSFQRTLKGLEWLVKKRKQYGTGHIAINGVYTPPYSEKKIRAIHDFFCTQDWVTDVDIALQYANYTSLKELFQPKDLTEETHLMTWALDEYKQSFSESSSMARGQLELRFAKLMQRSILAEPMDCYTLNGCCVPGQRKCYITTDGWLHVCEKILAKGSPIGHLDTGFDVNTIKKVYIEEYAQKSLPACSRCWALRLCDVCYWHAINEHGQLDLKQKHMHCHSTLKALERTLASFITLLSEKPEDLDYLKEYEIK